MTALPFLQARQTVVEQVQAAASASLREEHVPLHQAYGRILSRDILADRNYPAVARSVRDGFALRAADLPGEFHIIGEVRAGEPSRFTVSARQTVEIMTGAPVPTGADAVVMVEHTTRTGAVMHTDRIQKAGDFINPLGAEARAGDPVVLRGSPLTYPRIAMLATVGCAEVPVFRTPQIAILATGDEIVSITETPQDFQIRNSNAYSLAAQVRRAGGEPRILPVARDVFADTHSRILEGLESDMLLLSGGVSAGKYDLVEQVLSNLGAEFYFTRVLIQPGQPLVFGRVRNKFFFGLPGNPASTMVTFEIFARAALELLAGQTEPVLPFTYARLTRDFRHKTGLTRFLPALLSPRGHEVTPILWQGSSDVPSLSRANAFLVAEPDRESWNAGDWIAVLLQ